MMSQFYCYRENEYYSKLHKVYNECCTYMIILYDQAGQEWSDDNYDFENMNKFPPLKVVGPL